MRDAWALEALAAAEAPGSVQELAHGLVSMRDLFGPAWAFRGHDHAPKDAVCWLRDEAVRRLDADPSGDDAVLDAALCLLTGSRAVMETAGDGYSTKIFWPGDGSNPRDLDPQEDPLHPSWRVENFKQVPGLALARRTRGRGRFGLSMVATSSALAAMAADDTVARLRGLALAAVLCARPGLTGVNYQAYRPLISGPLRDEVPELCQHLGILRTKERTAASWIFQYLMGPLGLYGVMGPAAEAIDPSENPGMVLDFEDAFGSAEVPIGWAVFTLAMRTGSFARSGMDDLAYDPMRHGDLMSAMEVFPDARRFARRACMSLPSIPACAAKIGLRSSDALGSGWLLEEIALNLDDLWGDRHRVAEAPRVAS